MYKMTGCPCNAGSRVGQGRSYTFSKCFPPPKTRPTKRKAKQRQSTPHHEGGGAPPKHAMPAQSNRNNRNRPQTATAAQHFQRQDKPTIGRRRRRPTNKTTQPYCWQQCNSLTSGYAKDGRATTKHTRRDTNRLTRVYPGYAPYPLRSPLINFADDNLLTTATRHRDPENAGLATTTEQASAILQLTRTYLDAHQCLVHPRKTVGLADIGTPAPEIRKGEPLHLEDTAIHLGVRQATRHHRIALPSKLEGRLTQLPQLAWGDLLSTHGLAYFMEAVLNAAIGYPALHLPHPQDALRHAGQQVTKAWAQNGGWPTSFPKEAMMAHWRYYGDNTGALVDTAYAKHAAHLLQHNHQPEVREAAAIHIKEAQMARNTCPRRILAQHSVPTAVGTSIWAQLQLLLPHHMDAILTNHHCDQQGLLLATHTDVHRHLAGQVDTLCLVGATITIVYITPTQMRVMAQCGAHHAPFLSDPQWPVWRVFQAYLRACATKAGREVPGPKDIATGYKTFQHQHPRPRPSENKTPNDGSTKQKEPIPVSRRLDTTHHPAASTQQAQTRYPHHTATPCPLVHPQTQHPADQCTTSQTQ